MNAIEYVEKIKEINNLDTDYSVAKLLNCKQQKVSNWRDGGTMDNEAARQVAQILNIPVWQVIADMEAQRQKDPSKKKAWKMLAKMAKEKGATTPSLLILLGFFSALFQFCILC
jgi:hypothetical protein